MNMNRIQLAQWRDIAIEYLPAAQQFREEVKARPTEDRESQSYAMGLWNIADKTMARHEATVAELTAAMVVQGLSELEMYDPANLPALNKLNRARNPAQNDMSDKDMRDWMLTGIENAVKTLARVTGRNIPIDDPLVYFVEPAAEVEAGAVTSPSGDKIPGKIPNTTIGKLAIKAAWLIECETGKRATAKQVIERLQSWVDHKDNPEAVTELTGKIANGVMWVTRAGKGRPYDIGACQKALETWNKNRD